MTTKTQVVQQALGAVVGGDIAAATAVVADDFVWQIPGSSRISGEVAGVEGWAEKLRTLLGAGLRPQVLAMLEGEEHVAVLQRNVAESGAHSLDIQVVNLFTVREGKVVRLDTFFGDQTAAETFWDAALG